MYIGPFQFNYLSYELFLEKKSCQTPKKKKKKVTFGVLRTKVVLKFPVRLQKKKSASFKNILCKGEFNHQQISDMLLYFFMSKISFKEGH